MIKPTANSERYYGSEEPFFLARSGYFTPHRRIAVIPGISEGEYNQILALRSDGRIFRRDWHTATTLGSKSKRFPTHDRTRTPNHRHCLDQSALGPNVGLSESYLSSRDEGSHQNIMNTKTDKPFILELDPQILIL